MLHQDISRDYVAAMKAKESTRSSTLNFLRAQLKNVQIEKRSQELSDDEVIAVIKKQVKQRQDSIEQYRSGGREDLAAKEAEELSILQTYLPQEMPAAEVEVVVDEAIKEAGATSFKDMGKVMKITLGKVGGRADGQMVSQMVKQRLSEL